MDENDDSDDEAVGDILFGHVNEHSLRIVSETLDDLFTGVSSKKRFSRAPNQDHMTFIPQTEFMIYSNFHVIPHLRHLFASGANLFIWLAVLMEFRQVIIYQCIGSIFLSTHFSLIPYFKKTGIIPTSDNFYTASPRQVADPSDTCERWSSYR